MERSKRQVAADEYPPPNGWVAITEHHFDLVNDGVHRWLSGGHKFLSPIPERLLKFYKNRRPRRLKTIDIDPIFGRHVSKLLSFLFMVRLSIKKVCELLRELGFPERFNTDQTAHCVIAMADTQPREGLVLGHRTLHEGARIHDMIAFARKELRKHYAENTRESIRKMSCKQLVDYGLAIANPDDPGRPTNSGNWHYVLASDFLDILNNASRPKLPKLVAAWLRKHPERIRNLLDLEAAHIQNALLPDGKKITLSPGKHNALVKLIVEVFAARFIEGPVALYIGDTREKMLFVNEESLKGLSVELGVHEKLPDVIFYSKTRRKMFAIEAVTSVGPITDLRRREIQKLLGRNDVVFVTAFPSRGDFKKFADQLAWGTVVWIADEPEHIIRFNGHIS